MSIATKAMVLNLNIGLWQGYRLDREASRKVTDEANAEDDAARVNKHLVPRVALRPIVSAAGAIRSHFYEKTLPWKDNGDRLLTRVMYTRFIEEHEELVGEFKDAVKKFLRTDYPNAVEQASFRMGDLFKPEDYPRASDLERRFYVHLDIDAVSEAGDFRVQMSESEVGSIRKQMEEAMEQRLAGAMKDVWERLLDVVDKFRIRMADTDAIFRDTIVTNISDLVDLLPGLNVLDDPELERMRVDIQRTLAGYDPKDLRKDEAARSQAASEAQKIMDTMKGYMNAFGGQG